MLSGLIEFSGQSRRQVESKLLEQGRGTDLGRLLSGRLDLKLRHVIDLTRILGVHPVEFFRLVFGDPRQRSALLLTLQGFILPQSRDSARSVDELQQLLRRFAEITADLNAHLEGEKQEAMQHRAATAWWSAAGEDALAAVLGDSRVEGTGSDADTESSPGRPLAHRARKAR